MASWLSNEFMEIAGLLHLAPNSPDAQVFYEFGNRSNQSSSTPVPAPTPGGNCDFPSMAIY